MQLATSVGDELERILTEWEEEIDSISRIGLLGHMRGVARVASFARAAEFRRLVDYAAAVAAHYGRESDLVAAICATPPDHHPALAAALATQLQSWSANAEVGDVIVGHVERVASNPPLLAGLRPVADVLVFWAAHREDDARDWVKRVLTGIQDDGPNGRHTAVTLLQSLATEEGGYRIDAVGCTAGVDAFNDAFESAAKRGAMRDGLPGCRSAFEQAARAAEAERI